MKFGLMFFAAQEDDTRQDKYRLILSASRFADRKGFSAVWVPERHFTPMGCLYPNPAVLQAALARETERIDLRAGSVVAPLHHPLRIAEEWSMVDNLSNGRVSLSFASGWNPADFAFFPDRYPKRHEEMFSAIETVRRLWRGEPMTILDGRGEQAEVRIYPTPVQQELPVWVTAAKSLETFRAAGAIGAHLLTHMMDTSLEQLAEKIAAYRQARAEHGHDPEAGEVSLMLHTFVGPTAGEVDARARQPYCRYLEENVGLMKSLAASRDQELDLESLNEQERADFFTFLYERFAASRGLIGTPETCRPLVASLEEIGVNEVACLLDFGIETEEILNHLPFLDELRALCQDEDSQQNVTSMEPPKKLREDEIRLRCSEERSGREFYEDLQKRGVDFDSGFRGVKRLWRRDGEALAEVIWPLELVPTSDVYSMHPAFLDACFQVFAAAMPQEMATSSDAYFPTKIREFRLFGPLGRKVLSHARLVSSEPERLEGNIALYDDEGIRVAQLAGLRLQRLAAEKSAEAWRDHLYAPIWQRQHGFRQRQQRLPALDALQERIAGIHEWACADDLVREQKTLKRLDEISPHYILDAFTRSGLVLRQGEIWSFTRISKQLRLVDTHRRLVLRLLAILTGAGVLEEQDEGWRVIQIPDAQDPRAQLEALMANGGSAEGSLALLERCGEKLAEVLRGEEDPVALLFPGGNADHVHQLYHRSPTAQVMNALIRQGILEALEALPADQGLRILEIGAGTGGTTAALLPHLPSDRIEYVFTDIGARFTAKAEDSFAGYDFLRYRTLDIEVSPVDTGFEPQAFDIVIAANVLHATRDLNASLHHANQLLAPGGWLILLEATARNPWVDLTFGLTDGWWRFADERKEHPLLSAKSWQQLLLAKGFDDVAITPGPDEDLGQAVILAQKEERQESTGRTWLLLTDSQESDEQGLGEALCRRFRQRGEAVVRVKSGTSFGGSVEAGFRIRPNQSEDHQELVQSLPAIDGILLLWSPESSRQDEAQTFERPCESAFHFTRTWLELRADRPRTLWITEGAQSVLEEERLSSPFASSLWGMARVVELEHPELPLQCLDLDASSSREEQVSHVLTVIVGPLGLREDASKRERQIAQRGPRRYTARLSRVTSTAEEAVPLSLDEEATYWITGGLGGLARRTARWMIKRGAKHLVLVGRRPAEGEILESVENLRALGAEIEIACADVTDPEQLDQLLKGGDPRFPLRGVIHMAAVFEIGLLARQPWDRFLDVLRPKILGAWNLHNLTESLPLDFFVLYSSMASLLPYHGLAGYAAANAFLDALAHHRRAMGLPALTVNWGTWSEVGRMAQIAEQEPQRLLPGESTFSPEEGFQAFESFLMGGPAQIGLIPIDWAAFFEGRTTPPFLRDLAPPETSETEKKVPVSIAVDPTHPSQLQPSPPAVSQPAAISLQLQKLTADLLRVSEPEDLDPEALLLSLGLDSLMAVELRSQIQKQFQVAVPVVDFLDGMTISQLTDIIQKQTTPTSTEVPESDEEEFALSHGQSALWFLQQLAPENSAYNIMCTLQLIDHLDLESMELAARALVDRHPSLRTTYSGQDEAPSQRIGAARTDSFRIVEATEDGRDWRTWALEESAHPFDLEEGPVVRMLLRREARHSGFEEPKRYVFLLVIHHIAADLVSLRVLLDELATLYASFQQGTPLAWTPASSYQKHVAWEAEQLRIHGKQLEGYWLQQLEGELPTLNLPTDHPRPPVQTHVGREHDFLLTPELTQNLKAFAQTQGVTPYMTLLTAFFILLSRYSGTGQGSQDEILIGTPVDTRNGDGDDIGYYVNPLVLRTRVAERWLFTRMLQTVRRLLLGALEHRAYPFPLLVEKLQPKRDPSRSPIFQVEFVWDQFLAPVGEQGSFLQKTLLAGQRGAEFDLSLTCFDMGETLRACFRYNADLFEPATLARMAKHYMALLVGIVEDPLRSVASLPMLSEAERHGILNAWNDTTATFPEDRCFHHLFADQATRTPQAIAVLSRTATPEAEDAGPYFLSYAELELRSSTLARSLTDRGIAPGVRVALLALRSQEYLIALLAILKAGGVYLPLDPRQPSKRLGQILSQSQPSLILVDRSTNPNLQEALEDADLDIEVMDLKPIPHNEIARFQALSTWHARFESSPQNLAYVIFTSGSTGLPKGVMVEHRGMLNHLYAKIQDLELTSADSIAQNAPQTFDISVWQFLVALLLGGQTCILEDEIAHDPKQLLAQVARQKVAVLEAVPSLLAFMLEEVERQPIDLPTLRWFIPTGEALPPELARRWLARYPRIPMLNAYGPTECSDDVTHHPIHHPPDLRVINMPIGRSIANMEVNVLDRSLQLSPIGVPGELYVSGQGVGRGYLRDPKKTALAFLPSPFSSNHIPGDRLYKTGDLARRSTNGVIEFLGRIDHQVKVRGFRIELGEIENALQQSPDIDRSIVLALADKQDQKRLVAYVVPDQSSREAVSVASLRTFLQDRLPGYMVPAAFVFLESLPLTPNGKVDRKALPEPDTSDLMGEDAIVPPRNPVEEGIAQIYGQTLELPRVGVHQDFFDLGGHSLLATRVVARLQEKFEVTIPLRRLFEGSTVAQLAREVEDIQLARSLRATRTEVERLPVVAGGRRVQGRL